jgi:propionyl-CoA carboxylase alpha chain
MNTRLQVEHPVTEMITDLDLVELQLRIAEGDPLPFTQEQVTFRGHAIEVRVCAEDPARGFVPTTGMITRYAAPKSHNVRVDSGIAAGSLISIYYDSLLAKVITWGDTREDARKTMVRALNGYHIEGPSTNVDFANAVLTHPAFIAGDLSTAFIEEHFPDGRSLLPCNAEHLNNLVIASVLVYHTRRHLVRESLKPLSPLIGTTPEPKLWHDYVVRVDDAVHEIKLEGETNDHRWFITISGVPFEVVTPEFEYYRRRLLLKINGESQMFRLQYDANHIKAFHGGLVKLVEIYTPREWAYAAYMPKPKEPVIENALRCPMPGLVTAVSVADGDLVRKGQELVRMESMKMEAGIASPCDARVDKALVAPGQTVDTDEILITFKT